ncbi:MAG: CBS domain-containing protein, partial [Actinobacteria bacterium]
DRGLRRLAVTFLDGAALDHPPTVPPDATLAAARTLMDGRGRALVVDAAGHAHGYLERADVADDVADGPATSRMRPLPALVPVHATLADALATLLRHDAPWVAVVDGDRYVGVLTPDGLHAASRRSS